MGSKKNGSGKEGRDPEIYIGTSGWSYDHWVDLFYPDNLKKKEWFPYYTGHFNSVELNMSFYRYPFRNMLKGWKNKMPEDFKMTFKVNRRITHYKKFRDVEGDVNKFYDLTELLEEHTGCMLFQTPPNFHNTGENREIIEQFLHILRGDHDNVIEFRHPSWWDEKIKEVLHKYNVAFCTVSGLEMPSRVMISADFAYFRFHGPGEAYASEYSEAQLADWAEAIWDEIEGHHLRAVYCYFNNDNSGYAIANAKTLKKMLSRG